MIHEIGPHRVRHGDLMDGLADLMQGEVANLVYCDPPWAQQALSMFETMNAKQTGAGKPGHRIEPLLAKLAAQILTHARGPVVLEYGQKWRDSFIALMEDQGLTHLDTQTAHYATRGGYRPYDVHLFDGVSGVAAKLPYLGNLHGIAVIREVLRYFAVPGGILLDPCCGLGLVAQAAREADMRFRGNELNAARLQRTIRRLR